ncbi:hypothetical protein DN069_01465 [Streptacidiphilus pinicola]|uniref:Uncharacterized protein n=1 Tax=Streptacidiphilus pinicola TaxID=2219663 RepID=A0A2X0IRK1_9ACTN|nr:hypothetical protein [Streptacidiphilus pinicola]RAG87237.1 hypothetical protein DN069_01465 [Streptacidiphilus pinicola]
MNRLWGAVPVVVGAVLAVSGCAVGLGASASVPAPAPAARPAAAAAAAAAYLAIATPANHRLDADFDRFDGADRGDLAAARADLRDIAATEHAFDRDLARLALPQAAAAWVRPLISANETRADLTARAATSGSLPLLNGLRPRLTAANAPVERAVTGIRADLGLPPPDTH